MSPRKSSKKLVLDQMEVEVLLNTWLCMETKPEINASQLASLTKYGNTRSVVNLMTAIGKKVQDAAEDGTELKLVTPWSDGKGKGKGKGTRAPKTRKRKSDPGPGARKGGSK